MGDIAFNIEKNVVLNKVVNLEIDKDVDVNVENDDLLATAEADAEAFGEDALAETDAFTYVNGGEPGDSVFIPNFGAIDVLGNTTPIVLGEDGDGDDAADTVTVDFTSAGTVVEGLPDVDDINGFDSLASLSSPPPDTADAPIPDPLLSITDLNLTQTGVVTIINGILEAEYVSDADWVVNFGERTLDLDGDGETTTDELLLTVPAGSGYLVEFLEPGNLEAPVELQFETFAAGNGFFTFDGETYDVTGFVFEAESLQDIPIGDYAFEAESLFGRTDVTPPTPGEAFSYAESTAALDLNGDAIAGDATTEVVTTEDVI